MNWTNVLGVVENTITGVGLRVLGAIVLYIVGRWLIAPAASSAARQTRPTPRIIDTSLRSVTDGITSSRRAREQTRQPQTRGKTPF